jgi:hypothetical protein
MNIQENFQENFDTRVSKIFHFCMNTVNALRQEAEKPALALRFYLQVGTGKRIIKIVNCPFLLHSRRVP